MAAVKRARTEEGWVMQPKQKRTTDRLERIFEVAEELFAAKGFAATRMEDVAQAVPCSMSALYDRFQSKRGLLHAMHERAFERARRGLAVLGARGDGQVPNLRLVLPIAIAVGSAELRMHRGLRRAVQETRLTDPPLAVREERLRRLVAQASVDFIASCHAQIDHPDPRLAAEFVSRLTSGLLIQRYDGDLEPEYRALSDEAFQAEILRICLRYLGEREPETVKRRVPKSAR